MEPIDSLQKVDTDLVNKCIRDLRARFHSVQVFVSRETQPEDFSVGMDEDNTISCVGGSGNLHARVGHCRRWLTQVEELDRKNARLDIEGDDYKGSGMR